MVQVRPYHNHVFEASKNLLETGIAQIIPLTQPWFLTFLNWRQTVLTPVCSKCSFHPSKTDFVPLKVVMYLFNYCRSCASQLHWSGCCFPLKNAQFIIFPNLSNIMETLILLNIRIVLLFLFDILYQSRLCIIKKNKNIFSKMLLCFIYMFSGNDVFVLMKTNYFLKK